MNLLIFYFLKVLIFKVLTFLVYVRSIKMLIRNT